MGRSEVCLVDEWSKRPFPEREKKKKTIGSSGNEKASQNNKGVDFSFCRPRGYFIKHSGQGNFAKPFIQQLQLLILVKR